MKGIFENHIGLTSKVLDLRLERQNLVMGNLSNIDTPGYKPRRMEFEKELQDAMALDARGKVTRTNNKHMPSAFTSDGYEADFIKDFEPREVFGQDQVDLDEEMGLMAKNAMMYNALTDVLKKNFEGLRQVIMEGAK